MIIIVIYLAHQMQLFSMILAYDRRTRTYSNAEYTALTAANIYTVARNKIPHRKICNISATNGLILKILEAA